MLGLINNILPKGAAIFTVISSVKTSIKIDIESD